MNYKTIWVEPCGCSISEFEEGKGEVRKYRHNKAHGGDIPFPYSPLFDSVDGWDADGAPVPATYSI